MVVHGQTPVPCGSGLDIVFQEMVWSAVEDSSRSLANPLAQNIVTKTHLVNS